MNAEDKYIKGRGAQINPANKFAKLQLGEASEFDAPDEWESTQNQKTQIG